MLDTQQQHQPQQQLLTPMTDDSEEPDLGMLRLRSGSAPAGSLAADVQAALASEPPASASAAAAEAAAVAAESLAVAEPAAPASAVAAEPEYDGLADMAVSPPRHIESAAPDWGREGALAAAAAGRTPGETGQQRQPQRQQQQQQQQCHMSAFDAGGSADGDMSEQAADMEEAPPLPQLARSMPVPVSPVGVPLPSACKRCGCLQETWVLPGFPSMVLHRDAAATTPPLDETAKHTRITSKERSPGPVRI